MHPVTSLQNPTIKLLRGLSQRKLRRRANLFLAEGAKVVATARDRGWTPQYLVCDAGTAERGIVAELAAWAEGAGAQCLAVPRAVLSTLTTKDNPQTVVAAFQPRHAELPTDPPPDALWAVLEGISDPGNLGTIVRTVDAVGGEGVILVGDCCDPYSREAVRASMGSIFAVQVAACDRAAFLDWRAGWPGEVVGTHLAATDSFSRDYPGPTLIVMGAEGPGLSDELAAACSALVRIPMAGGADSLNLAVATALMLYEARRGKV